MYIHSHSLTIISTVSPYSSSSMFSMGGYLNRAADGRWLVSQWCMGWDGVEYAIKIDERESGGLFMAILKYPIEVMCSISLVYIMVCMEKSSPEALG